MNHLPLPARRLGDRAHLPSNRINGDKKPDLRIKNVSADVTEIMIYDEIGYWYISAESVIEQLNRITTPKIVLRINSPGGDVFEAAAIYNAMRRHPAEKTATVDGMALSAASWVALACDKVTMGAGAYMMVHNVSTYTFGEAADLRRDADLLDKMTGNIAGIYAERTGKTAADWLALMDVTTWFTASEAVEAGLADETTSDTPPDVVPSNKFDVSQFANVPDELKKHLARGPRDIENILRDAGVSKSQAKAAVSDLKNEARRDAGDSFTETLRNVASGLKTINEIRKENLK